MSRSRAWIWGVGSLLLAGGCDSGSDAGTSGGAGATSGGGQAGTSSAGATSAGAAGVAGSSGGGSAGSAQAGTGAMGGAAGAPSGGSAGTPTGGAGGSGAGGIAGSGGLAGAGGSSMDAGADAHPCGDTSNDPYNCGSCGRACPNPQGSCTEGRCGPALTDCVQYPKYTPPFPTCNSACQDQGLKCVQGGCSLPEWPNVTSAEYRFACDDAGFEHVSLNETCDAPVVGHNQDNYFRCCCEE